MRYRMPDFALAMNMLWIWLAMVAVAVAAYLGFLAWRNQHPLPVPKPEEPPYSQQLQRRLNEHRPTAKSKRSKGSPPKRHRAP